MPGGHLLSLRGESRQRRAKGGRKPLHGGFSSPFGILLLSRRSRSASGLRPWAYCKGGVRLARAESGVLVLSMLAPRGLAKRKHCIKQPSLAPVASADILPRVARRGWVEFYLWLALMLHGDRFYFRRWRGEAPFFRRLALMPRGQLLSLHDESNQRRAKEGGDTLSGCFPSLFGISLLFRWIAERLRAAPVGLLQRWRKACSRGEWRAGFVYARAAGTGRCNRCNKQPSLATVASADIPPRVARRCAALRGADGTGNIVVVLL